MQKKVGLAGVLVVLCGVSAYMWTSGAGEQADPTIAAVSESWRCSECDKQFDLTVAEATSMLRTTRHEIVCPHCGEGGAEREGELVYMGGALPTGSGGDGDDDDSEEEEEERPATPGGIMGPIGRP